MDDHAPLGSLAEINPRSPSARIGELISFVSMADVSERGYLENVRVRPASPGYTAFVEGDVLLAKITPCMENGKGAHIRGLPISQGQGSSEFHVLRARPGTSDRFLYHLTRTESFRLRAEALMTGSAGQRRVPTEFFSKYVVRVPPLDEQQRIAEILDTIDETIQASERVIEKRRKLLRGLQQRLLGHGTSTTTVNDLVSRHWPGEWGEESPAEGLREVLVLRATNLSDYSVDYATAARRFVPHLKSVDKRLEDGDLLLEGAGGGPGVPVGRVARFHQPDDDSAYLTSNFFRALRPRSGVDADYLYWLLDHEYRKPSIWSCQQQTTGIINLKLQDYLERPVAFSRDRQIEIAEALNEALRAIDMECAAADKLRETRAGLAVDLLSGRVRTVAA